MVFVTVRVASFQVVGRLAMNTNIEITSNDGDEIRYWLTTIVDRYRPAGDYAVENTATGITNCYVSLQLYGTARVVFPIENGRLRSIQVKMEPPEQDLVTFLSET